MPTASLSRNTVRQEIGRSSGLLFGRRTFSVTAASPTQFDSVDLPVAAADTLLGKMVYIPSGGGSGQARTVVSSLTTSPMGVPSGSRLYLDRGWTTVPSTNAAIELWDKVWPETVNELIKDAVRAVGKRVLQHKEEEIDLLDDTFTYNLPESSPSETGFAYLSEVWFEDTTLASNPFTVPIPPAYYTIDRDSTPRTITFHERALDHLIATGRKAKLVGQRFPRVPEDDDDILEVDTEYVRVAVLTRIWDSLPWSDNDRSRYDRWKQQEREYLERVHSTVYPDSIEIEAF